MALTFSSCSVMAIHSHCRLLLTSPSLAKFDLVSFDGLRSSDSTNVSSLSSVHQQGICSSSRLCRQNSALIAVKAALPAAPPLRLPKQKIRIKLKSYWVPWIEQACKQILEAVHSTNTQIMGPVPLPTKRRVYCALRSPHVNTDSREHFEIRTHQRLIDIENPDSATINMLMQLDLPAGVDVEVKLS